MPKLTDIVASNLPGSGGLDARYNNDPASPYYLNPDAQEIRFAGHSAEIRDCKRPLVSVAPSFVSNVSIPARKWRTIPVRIVAVEWLRSGIWEGPVRG
jgi:hypothetical protein